ncbi:MAG: hypothetical protein FJZ01_04335 [Candidatus Sericytochromatia bacterium]|nr:hypothetical protein [Candidatus Tanganyikabacteria bacterium]
MKASSNLLAIFLVLCPGLTACGSPLPAALVATPPDPVVERPYTLARGVQGVPRQGGVVAVDVATGSVADTSLPEGATVADNE